MNSGWCYVKLASLTNMIRYIYVNGPPKMSILALEAGGTDCCARACRWHKKHSIKTQYGICYPPITRAMETPSNEAVGFRSEFLRVLRSRRSPEGLFLVVLLLFSAIKSKTFLLDYFSLFYYNNTILIHVRLIYNLIINDYLPLTVRLTLN